MRQSAVVRHGQALIEITGREIPEELAARTDRGNEFPVEMWKKLGEAGYMFYDIRHLWDG